MFLSGCHSVADSNGESFSSCPAPRFSSLGVWNNTDLPTVVEADGRDPGVGVGDLDGDGDEDLVYGWAGNTQVFWNDGQGTLSVAPPVTIDGRATTRSRAIAIADINDDGTEDLFVGHDAPFSDELLLNDGSGLNFRSYQLPQSQDTSWSVSLGDFNRDGKTDVYTATYAVAFDVDLITQGDVIGKGHAFWMQQNPEQWERMAVPTEVDTALSLQGAVIDVDQDGLLDLYMVNDFGPYVLPNRLLHNSPKGQFFVDNKCHCDLSIYSMGAAVGDADGNGSPDLVVTDIGAPHLLLNDGTGDFYDATIVHFHAVPAATRMTSWGASLTDLDLDGDVDALLAYGALGPNASPIIGQIANTDPTWTEEQEQYSSVYLNDGDGNFTLLPEENFLELERSRVVAIADLDGDLRPDLVVAGRNRIQAWRNEGGCTEGVVLSLRGAAGNRGAFGAKVEVEVGEERYTRWLLPSTTGSQSTKKLFLGMEGQKEIERLTITWPDGAETVVTDVSAGALTVSET